MVKLNNPVTSSNGEHAMWLDGVKVSHLGQGFPNGYWSGGIFTQDPGGSPFEGFRWRSDSNLKLNWIWLQNYSPDHPPGVAQDMKFDHVVVAASYIGCLPIWFSRHSCGADWTDRQVNVEASKTTECVLESLVQARVKERAGESGCGGCRPCASGARAHARRRCARAVPKVPVAAENGLDVASFLASS